MRADLQEHACWLLLVFESGLTRKVVNHILAVWCKQLNRTLTSFFQASSQELHTTCHLGAGDVQKLELARGKLTGQVFLAERLQHEGIQLVTVLDPSYPLLLKQALKLGQLPPMLFTMGDLQILQRQTIAIIGSRNASEVSLNFTRAVASHVALHKVNVISGHARGVDRTAYEGAIAVGGYTTVVLPHGLFKLSKVQMREMLPKIENKHVLVVSPFHPNAPWLVSRAMERNHVVTSLAQIVVVAESGEKGGTWEGANFALKQKRSVYVRQARDDQSLPGNELLLREGARPLPWPTENLDKALLPLLQESKTERARQGIARPLPDQNSLFVLLSE